MELAVCSHAIVYLSSWPWTFGLRQNSPDLWFDNVDRGSRHAGSWVNRINHTLLITPHFLLSYPLSQNIIFPQWFPRAKNLSWAFPHSNPLRIYFVLLVERSHRSYDLKIFYDSFAADFHKTPTTLISYTVWIMPPWQPAVKQDHSAMLCPLVHIFLALTTQN